MGTKLVATILASLVVTAALAAASLYGLQGASAHSADLIGPGDMIEYHWQAIASDGRVLASSDVANASRGVVTPAGEINGSIELGPFLLGQRLGATVTTPVFVTPFGRAEQVWVPAGAGPFPLATDVNEEVLANASIDAHGYATFANGTLFGRVLGSRDDGATIRFDFHDGDVLRLPRLTFDARVRLLNATHFALEYLLSPGQSIRAGPCLLDLNLPQGNLLVEEREANGSYRATSTPLDVPARLLDVDAKFVLHIVKITKPEPRGWSLFALTARAAAPAPGPKHDRTPPDFGVFMSSAGCCDWCVTLAALCPHGVSTFRCGEFPSCDCYFLCAAPGIAAAALARDIKTQ